jgi:putative tryptophan/tyrosine transport system substrate-binding protein
MNRHEIIAGLGSVAAWSLAARAQQPAAPVVSPLASLKNIAHPEGNVTGVTNLFGSIGGKWLELLKEAVPRLERVAYIHRVLANSRESYLPSIAEAARVLNVQAIDIPFRLGDAVELMRGIDAFAADPGGGLILHPGVAPYQETILMLAAQHRLPTVVGGVRGKEGALIAYYGSTAADLVRRVAFLVDRILRGAKVGELPVEYPTRFDLVINLKTAKAIGLTIPESLLLRADEIIE